MKRKANFDRFDLQAAENSRLEQHINYLKKENREMSDRLVRIFILHYLPVFNACVNYECCREGQRRGSCEWSRKSWTTSKLPKIRTRIHKSNSSNRILEHTSLVGDP